MRKNRFVRRLFAAPVLALFAITGSAHADDLGDPYLGVELMLGFAGDMEVEVSEGASIDFTPDVAFGGGVIYMHPLLQYFALGGRFAVLSWRSDSDGPGSRNLAFDLAAVPQLRLPLAAAVELYVAVPVGITLDLLNELEGSADLSFAGVSAGASVDADAGVGWNIAGMVGARFAVSSGFGLFAEIGYGLHQVSHDVRVQLGVGAASTEATADLDVSWSQVALNVGAYF